MEPSKIYLNAGRRCDACLVVEMEMEEENNGEVDSMVVEVDEDEGEVDKMVWEVEDKQGRKDEVGEEDKVNG